MGEFVKYESTNHYFYILHLKKNIEAHSECLCFCICLCSLVVVAAKPIVSQDFKNTPTKKALANEKCKH